MHKRGIQARCDIVTRRNAVVRAARNNNRELHSLRLHGDNEGPGSSRCSVDSWNAGRTIGVFCSISKWKATRPSVPSDPNIQFAARVASIKLFSRPEWQFYGISILSRNGDSRVALNNSLSSPSSLLDFCNFISGILIAAGFRGPHYASVFAVERQQVPCSQNRYPKNRTSPLKDVGNTNLSSNGSCRDSCSLAFRSVSKLGTPVR